MKKIRKRGRKKFKAYELVPIRTRIRMYARKIYKYSKGRISYNTLRSRIIDKFGIDLKDLDIKKKDIVKLFKTNKINISRKDIKYENRQRL